MGPWPWSDQFLEGSKPIDKDELERVLRNILNKHSKPSLIHIEGGGGNLSKLMKQQIVLRDKTALTTHKWNI
jgi:hypothetical protein